MRVIIAGSRPPQEIRRSPQAIEGWYILHQLDVPRAVAEAGFEITEVVSGCAQGYDKLGERWALSKGLPVKPFPAQWKRLDGTFDHEAGFKRNQQMAEYADALIAIYWDKPTSGTQNMVTRMLSLKKPLKVVRAIQQNRPD